MSPSNTHADGLLASFVLDEWTFRRALSMRRSGCLETRPLWDSAQLPDEEQSLMLMCWRNGAQFGSAETVKFSQSHVANKYTKSQVW